MKEIAWLARPLLRFASEQQWGFGGLAPELIAFVMLVTLILKEMGAEGATEDSQKGFGLWNLAAGLAILASLLALAGKTTALFGGMILVDSLGIFFKAFFTLTLLAVIFLSLEFFKEEGSKTSEFYMILWTSLLGLFFLVSANDFLLLFVSLETVALSLYILSAYSTHQLISIEAGLKYFILGSLASAFTIFGIALLYVAVGSTSLPDIRLALIHAPREPLLVLAVLFITAGLGFKVSSVPFQLWVPDVYEGAPTPVVAFLSVASKAAGFAVLLRLFFTVFNGLDRERLILFSILAAATLVTGTLGALAQTNIKRLFGYSSIGHAGYLLIGIAAGKMAGTAALIYYLISFGLSNLAAFFVIGLVGRHFKSDQISAYRGLARQSPYLAAAFFLSLISLAGAPPLAGFFGKFFILLAALQERLDWLVLIGLLGVAVSLFYYLNIIRVMYVEEPEVQGSIEISLSTKWILAILMAGILIVGIWQRPFLELARQVSRSLF